MTQDQVFVPKTRSQLGLPPFNPEKENLQGSSVSKEVMSELYEAIGDAPLMTAIMSTSYLVCPHRSWLMHTSFLIKPEDCRLAYVPHHQRVWPETLPCRS